MKKPSIDNVTNLPLSNVQQQILEIMFAGYDRLTINSEFSDGFGGARVLQILPSRKKTSPPPEMPVVVKLGAKNIIDREFKAYTNHLKDVLPHTIGIKNEPTYLENQGGIYYPLLGSGIFEVVNLLDYIRETSISEIHKVLEVLMDVIERMVRYNEARSQYNVRLSYDRLLPLNLLIDQAAPPFGATVHVIRPDQLPTQPLHVNDYVRVEGFAVVKNDPGRQTVTLNIPEEMIGLPTAYYLRFQSINPDQVPDFGTIMPAIEGRILQTRDDFFRSEINRMFQSDNLEFDLSNETLLFPERVTLSNPLFALNAFLNRRHDLKWTTIHGDMNFRNVLINIKTGDVNIIDYSEARQDHALYDFLRLETEVMVSYIPQLMAKYNLSPVPHIRDFYHQLHWYSFYRGSESFVPHLPHPALKKPLEMLRFIRKTAQRYLFAFNKHEEYYQALIAYLLGALKFENLTNVKGAYPPKKVAFVAAATLAGMVKGEFGKQPPPCPYRGLKAFDVEHAPFFFGREEVIQQLLERLQQMVALEAEFIREIHYDYYSSSAQKPAADQPRLLALVGASGSGKSSLARAGLIGSIKQGDLTGSESWPIIILRPKDNPLESLSRTLQAQFEKHPHLGQIQKQLYDLPSKIDTLHRVVEEILSDAVLSQKVLVFVDQFEEVFSQEENIERRQAFLDNLLYAAQVENGRTIVLFTLRADYYDKFITLTEWGKILPVHQVNVLPLKKAQLHQAIELPATKAGCTFEPGLVEQIVHEVENQPRSLPLLQHALLELWESQVHQAEESNYQQAQFRITKTAYEKIGGVAGALQRRADAEYYKLSRSQQKLCQDIFLRLVKTGDGEIVNKQEVLLQELLNLASNPAEVQTVINNLAAEDARLLTITSAGEKDRHKLEEMVTDSHTYVEIAHEALIAHWEHLQQWIAVYQESLHIRDDLNRAAAVWQKENRDDSYLWHGARLFTAEEWYNRGELPLPSPAQMFLAASIEQRDQEQQQQEEQRQRELAIARVRNRRLTFLVIGLLISITWVVIARNRAVNAEAAAEARRQEAITAEARAAAGEKQAKDAQVTAEAEQIRAEYEARQAQARALANAALTNLTTDPELSILLAMQAVSTTYPIDGNPTDEAEQALHQAIQTSRVRHTLVGHAGGVLSVTFSPDGTLLATGSEDKTARVWNAKTGEELLAFTTHSDGVWDVVFSPDGARLATASLDGTAKLWDIDSGAELLTLLGHTEAVKGVAFSPDGAKIATASQDNMVKVWDSNTGALLLDLDNHTQSVEAVAFSPDGRQLASASQDHTAMVWDSDTGAQLLTLADHTDRLWHVTFSPNGAWLVTTSQDETAKVWKLPENINSTGVTIDTPSQTLPAQNNVVWSAAFSPDGQRLATANGDHAINLWGLRSERQQLLLLTLLGHTEAVRDVAFSPDGTKLASASEDKTIKIWDVAGHSDVVNEVVFSPNGTHLASASQDNTAKLWQVSRQATGDVTVTEAGTLAGHRDEIRRVTFSPDGAYLATASYDGTAIIWAATGQPLEILDAHGERVHSVAFSPDGSRLATASDDKTAKIWHLTFNAIGNPVSAEEQLTLQGHRGWVGDVVFSPDGKLLATASSDRTARVWDATSGRQQITLPDLKRLGSVVFNPSGSELVTASIEGEGERVQIWDLQTGEVIRSLSGHTNQVRDVVFDGTGARLATASYDNTARIWEAASGTELLRLTNDTHVNSAAFSPDGTLLATANNDGTLHLYVLDGVDPLLMLARHRVTRLLTEKECRQYLQRECP